MAAQAAAASKKPATAKKGGGAAPAPAAPAAPAAPDASGASGSAAAPANRNALMVRMYRVGFGDFFLITVPTAAGPRYILVDCGVHAGNLGSMSACVDDLARLTGRKLALVIVTHKHADHLSGFASEAEAFKRFEVEAVWITNRLDPADKSAQKLHEHVAAVAAQVKLQLQLSARTDPAAAQAKAMAENALGAATSSNDKALQVVTAGFANNAEGAVKPVVSYCQAGDTPPLPKSLQGVLTYEILGPAPKDIAARYSASDNRTEQFLAAAAQGGVPDARPFQPFDRRWRATAADYDPAAFRPWASPGHMEALLREVQPDALAAAAAGIDGTLNNQSLVVLFTCQGKNLLFVGDAQWGNWASWLYGQPVTGKAPDLTDRARQILASVDFYKVGHHGSTNATPIPVVGALKHVCVGMCSTDTGFPGKRLYGSIDKHTEVPRIPLIEALEKQTGQRIVRSDWLPMASFSAKASPEALGQMDVLPGGFVQGPTWIEYVFH